MEIKVADVAELVDARDLKSLDGNVVWVRVPPPAPMAVPRRKRIGTPSSGVPRINLSSSGQSQAKDVRPPRHKKAPASSGAFCFMRLRSLPGGRGDHMAFAVVGPGLLCRSRGQTRELLALRNRSLIRAGRAFRSVCAAGQQQPSGPSTRQSARRPRKVRTVFRIVVSVKS